MRLSVSIAGLALVLASVTACSDDSDLMSESELEDILLTSESLAAGFEVSEEDDDEDTGFGCLSSVDDLDGEEKKVDVEFAFDGPSGFPKAGNSVLAYEDASDIEDELDELVEQLEDCTEINETEDGATIELELEVNTEVTVDADQQVAFVAAGTISAEGQSFPFGMSLAAARVDNYMVGVLFATLGGDTDNDAAELLLSASVERLNAALDDESLPEEEPLLEDLVNPQA